MKTPKIVTAMNHIDDDIVAAAGKEPRARRPMWVRYTALAAALLLAFTGIFAVAGAMGQGASTVIALDVNPSMEIEIGKNERVKEIKALNADAETVLGDMDLKSVDLNVAVNAIIGSMLKHGYLTADRNSILISVDAENETRAAELQALIAGDITQILEAGNIEASVLSQSYAHDKKIEQMAEKNNISTAKATLIEKIVAAGVTDAAGNAYTEQALSALNIHELKLILQSKKTDVSGLNTAGTAALGDYLPIEQIVALVEADQETKGNLAASPLSGMEAELDFEHGRMVYSVEFRRDGLEFEYELDAKTGEIIKIESEPADRDDDDDRVILDESHISADAAVDAALAHAGLTRGEIRSLETEVETRGGVTAYSVEFETAGHEYEYLIDARTGEVIASEKERND